MFKRIKARYECPNENPEGVQEGLCPEEGDEVLSICGSGILPLYLLSKVNRIWAIDNSRRQIEIARYFMDCIEREDYHPLLELTSPRGMKKGIFTRASLERTREKLEGLELIEADLIDLPESLKSQRYSKIYTSNAPTHSFTSRKLISSTLEELKKILRPGGLMYITRVNGAMREWFEKSEELVEDCELTSKARELHGREKGYFPWKPVVYRKIAA